MDSKEYWERPMPKTKKEKIDKPIVCSCGKRFANDNDFNQHMRRFGKKDHFIRG